MKVVQIRSRILRGLMVARLLLLGFTSSAASSNFSLHFSSCSMEQHRIVLVKTHKTGSSTLANIIYRFGESRNLSFMLPKDDLRLGWPEPFPGRFIDKGASGVDSATGDSTFDIVAFHAVLNHNTMLRRIPEAKFITIVRDPVAQFTSAWYYFKNGNMKKRAVQSEEAVDEASSLTLSAINSIFPPYRTALRNNTNGKPLPVVDPESVSNTAGRTFNEVRQARVTNRLLNSQSFTLGWADFKIATLTAQTSSARMAQAGVVDEKPFLPSAELLQGDVDDDLIGRFLAYLDRTVDLILIVERLDESLIAMARILCWEKLADLEYLPVNVHKQAYRAGAKDDPLLEARLRQLLHVDVRLYRFANQRLSQQLLAMRHQSGSSPLFHGPVDVHGHVANLRERTQALGLKCGQQREEDRERRRRLTEGNLESITTTISEACWRLLADQRTYAQHLKALRNITCSRLRYRNPVKYSELPPNIQHVANQCAERGRLRAPDPPLRRGNADFMNTMAMDARMGSDGSLRSRARPRMQRNVQGPFSMDNRFGGARTVRRMPMPDMPMPNMRGPNARNIRRPNLPMLDAPKTSRPQDARRHAALLSHEQTPPGRGNRRRRNAINAPSSTA